MNYIALFGAVAKTLFYKVLLLNSDIAIKCCSEILFSFIGALNEYDF
jgi:hypothetical protein